MSYIFKPYNSEGHSDIVADDLGLEQDVDTGFVYPTLKGVRSQNGIPLSGSGSGVTSQIKINNLSGWLTKIIPIGGECIINVSWSSTEDSIPTGNGTLRVLVNNVTKILKEVEQGEVSIDVSEFLTSGENDIKLTISDVYLNSRTLRFSVSTVAIGLTSNFDETSPHSGIIQYIYTPVGSLEKTVHFLIDGEEIGTQTVMENNREIPYYIPEQPHGGYVLEVYFDGFIGGQRVESEHLRHTLICVTPGNNTPIIATKFQANTVKQYSTLSIPFLVYSQTLYNDVQLIANGEVVSERTVGRGVEEWPYKALLIGENVLSIVTGDIRKTIEFEVEELLLGAEAETNFLDLNLTTVGRSNSESNPSHWNYGSIISNLTNFNFKSDGWLSDENGNTVLRVAGDARVNIPFKIFESNFVGTGKTIEIEFATRDVRNYDALVLSAWSNNRGLKMTAQEAILKSQDAEVSVMFKDNEHIRLSFVIEKQNENRLMSIYINGIMSKVIQYGIDDNFSQSSAVGISIGSSDCTIDLYHIRVYGNNLNRHQVLSNWIADTENIDTLIERYNRNNIFENGEISINKIPDYVPYLVINANKYEDLPQSKGDVKIVDGYYLDPVNSEKSFTFENAEIDVQGTSSATYARKNYLLTFVNGIEVNGEHSDNYQLSENSIPVNKFTFKADVASSEGANNVELAMLYDDICPVKIPPQEVDDRVRQGIEGYPCLIFRYDGTNYHFIGKYNFNNDKATPEVFGFESGDESWEILQNNTDMVIWKDDNFEGDAWKQSFKARYPDKSTDVERLQAFSTWLKSTDTTAVNTAEEKAARLEKFKNEFSIHCNKDAMIFNYIFTEAFLMTDNRAKNAFPTRYDEDDKWLILPYDYDTALGINNSGELKFGYHLEDTDLDEGNKPIYNGQESVLYVNMRLAFADEIKEMYQMLRREGVFSYEEIERRFENHQSVWSEAIFNEDSKFKYLEPLINDGNSYYLAMLQGSKAEQRKWWLYNRFKYLDSKYDAIGATEDSVKLRAFAVSNITIAPYADIYAAVDYDGTIVKERALRGTGSKTLINPLTAGNEADIDIYSASQLSSLGDLSGLKLGKADFSKAIKLADLKVGSSSGGYTNPNLTELTVGNLTLLRSIDARNCTNLTQSINLSGCTNLESAYFTGTAITGVTLPDGGILKTLYLPSTITSLVIKNQTQISSLSITGYSNIDTLNLHNVDWSIFNPVTLLDNIATNARVRLTGLNLTMDTSEKVFEFYNKLQNFRGVDESGSDTPRPVISGTITCKKGSPTDVEDLTEIYPDVNIVVQDMMYRVKFYKDGELLSSSLLNEGDVIPVPSNVDKESSETTHYRFLGWSLDGVNITSIPIYIGTTDLTYIAVYEESVRYYRIRFFNGTVKIGEFQYKYNELPIWDGDTPVSANNPHDEFIGWTPEIGPVTEDVDYYATYNPAKTLEEYTWAEISEISAAGTGRSYFSIGDTKSIRLAGKIGVVNINDVFEVFIIGFDHNEQYEGTGIHFGTFKKDGKLVHINDDVQHQPNDDNITKYFSMNHDRVSKAYWDRCQLRYDILGSTDIPYDEPTENCATNPISDTFMSALPEDLRLVMKPMIKYTCNRNMSSSIVSSTSEYLPLMSSYEISGDISDLLVEPTECDYQEQYEYYALGLDKTYYGYFNGKISSSSVNDYWTRSGATGSVYHSCFMAGGNRSQDGYYSYGLAPIFKV